MKGRILIAAMAALTTASPTGIVVDEVTI